MFVLVVSMLKAPEPPEPQANSREYWTGKHDEWASQFEDWEIDEGTSSNVFTNPA